MTQHAWQSTFYHSPLFDSIAHHAMAFNAYNRWPELSDLNDYAIQQGGIANAKQMLLHCVLDTNAATLPYEHRIYLKQQLPTRRHNWHDFLNFLCWLSFPKSKACLNQQQYSEDVGKTPQTKQRTPLQNKMALFDECGMVVIADQGNYLDLIAHFQWHALFWQQREALAEHVQFFCYGHGLLEKALNPYVGMTGMSLLFLVESSLITNERYQQLTEVDRMVAAYFSSQDSAMSKLAPIPVLGIPGWDANNQHESYYENTDYFRQGRRQTGYR